MADVNQFIRSLGQLDDKWLGYRYLVAPTGLAIDDLSLLTVGISSISFPSISVSTRTIPTISTAEYKVPSKIVYGNLTLRAPVIKNSALFRKLKIQIDVLNGNNEYNPFGLVIAMMGGITLDLTPITIWVAEGCQAVSFSAPDANSNGTGNMPLESLTLAVDRFYRPTF